jgi:hypothetical protein
LGLPYLHLLVIKKHACIFICVEMSRNVVRGIFIPFAVKDLSEKVRVLSDGEGVKLSDCRRQVCDSDGNMKCVCQGVRASILSEI